MTKLMAMIDGSIYSRSVCDHTAWAAQRTEATVDIVHVLGRRTGTEAPVNLSGNLSADGRAALLEELAEHDAQTAKMAQKRGRLILDEAKTFLQEDGIDGVTAKLRHGDLVETVLDLEREADLMVIGKRGEAADFAKLHLGSNLERVVRSSHIPIMVASRAFKPISSFLIAFDGRNTAMKAVDHIARSPLFAGLRCRLLMVGQDRPDARKKLDDAETILKSGGFEVSAEIVAGQPDKVIADTVEREGIDLLVMGAYSHSRLRTLFIGSTTAEMVRGCLIPIMLFR
ncbi:MAG: universal stress protein [Alphaproteobacteria bacterium]|nr:universal stress protein [Alphaproteobacteria bacterium]